MHEELIIAGFGGQGVMLLGQILVYAGLNEYAHVLWMPVYGPETRGGFANCTVIISGNEIGSPIITHPDSLIILNLPSLNKFEDSLKPGGLMIANSSLIDRPSKRSDIDTILLPCTDVAAELGSAKAANMVALGAYIERTGVLSKESVFKVLPKAFPGKKEKLIPLNRAAIEWGCDFAKKAMKRPESMPIA